MRIALAQINPTLGDFSANAEKILKYIQRAKDKHCGLIVFPEMALFGYPAYDLLERSEVVDLQIKALQKLHKQMPKGITAVVGGVRKNSSRGKPLLNSAFVLQKGKALAFTDKQLLPSYDVFDETRFFQPGNKTQVFPIPSVGRVAITVCEDVWFEELKGLYSKNPVGDLKKGKIDLFVNISASPFSLGQEKKRLKAMRAVAQKLKVPAIYVDQVGAQDELIFDGSSFVLEEDGTILAQTTAFQEDLLIVDLNKRQAEFRPAMSSDVEKIHGALVLGIRDFVAKTGLTKVHLGLSGGIDSAVAAALAVDALGPNRVTGILLPGPYSSKGSVDDSLALAKNLRIQTHQFSISNEFELIFAKLKQSLKEGAFEIASENIQARLRAVVLMAFSNATGSLLLSTTNKSENATGYGTLYGDMAGGLAPLGDLTKKWIYALARYYNSHGFELIPKVIIEKAPSAELRPNQKDQDTLPPYDVLDKTVENLVENLRPAKSATDKWVLNRIYSNEFKRWQGAPILRVTSRAFGKGRRYPLAHKVRAN